MPEENPLRKHASGRWYKNVKGYFYYFHKFVDDPDGSKSLEKFRSMVDGVPLPVATSPAVYLLKFTIERESIYKIGRSMNPMQRLKGLSLPNVELVHAFKGRCNMQLESALHAEFKDKRLGLEWFRLGQEDVDGFRATCARLNKDIDKPKRKRSHKKKEFMNLNEAASMLDCRYEAVLRFIHSKEIEAVNISRTGNVKSWRISHKSIQDFIAKRTVQTRSLPRSRKPIPDYFGGAK